MRGGMCQTIYMHAKANNKYMKNYDKENKHNIISHALRWKYGWEMPQEHPVDSFKWVKDLFQFNERFIKRYDENNNKGYFLELHAEYLKKIFNLHKDLPFLPKREKNNKCEKLVCNIEDKKIYIIHIRALKQALNQGLILKRYTE